VNSLPTIQKKIVWVRVQILLRSLHYTCHF
jgi:hypothetical protein